LFVAGLALAGGAPVHAQSPAPAESAEPVETPPPIPKPVPTADDPKIHKLAVQQFLAWQTATVNRDLYSDTVNGELSDDVLDRATKTLANLGALQTVEFQGISKAKQASLYVYKMTCANGSVQMDFSLEPSGKIGLIFFE
jgi:hypothetical protein